MGDSVLAQEDKRYERLEEKLGDAPLSDEVLKGIMNSLDDIEELTGLKDAYKQQEQYQKLPSLEPFAETGSYDFDDYRSIESKLEPENKMPDYKAAASDHENRVINTATKHVINKRERDNMNLITVNFDKSLKDARLYVWILSPALWHWMYDDAGKIQFGIEQDIYN